MCRGLMTAFVSDLIIRHKRAPQRVWHPGFKDVFLSILELGHESTDLDGIK